MTPERAIEILTPDRLPDFTPAEYEEALAMARAALSDNVRPRTEITVVEG